MTLDYNIYNNTNKNYSLRQNKFNIWLINKNGDVLIKNILRKPDLLSIDKVTITSSSKSELTNKMSQKWSLEKNFKIKEIYSFKSKLDTSRAKIQIKGYVLSLHLNLKQQSQIEKSYKGSFINYRDLEYKFKNIERDSIFIEAYSELLRYLDNEFGWFKDLNIKYWRSPYHL